VLVAAACCLLAQCFWLVAQHDDDVVGVGEEKNLRTFLWVRGWKYAAEQFFS